MSVLDHTLAIGTYMSGFYDYLRGKGSEPSAPHVWHANLLHLCIHTVKIVHSASQNPVRYDFDVNRFSEGLARNLLDCVKTDTKLCIASVLTDRHNVPIAWYLPGLLPSHAQEAILTTIDTLPSIKTSSTARNSINQFSQHEDVSLRPRAVDISPAWYAQGHSGRAHKLVPSSILSTTRHQNNTWLWFSSIFDILAVLSGVLRLVHPEQYNLSIEALTSLLQSPDLLSDPDVMQILLEEWGLPFTGLAVLVNRSTSSHRDKGGRRSCYDICATVGTYPKALFSMPDIRTQVVYNSGCTVVLLARVLAHEVQPVVGDRVALVLFTKDTIHEALKIHPSPWPPTIHR